VNDNNLPILSARVLIPFIIVTLIWGSTWIVIKDQLGVVPPSWSVTYRFALAGVVMLAVAAITRAPLALTGRQWGFVAAFGIAQFVLNFNFVYRAEHYVTSGLVAVLFALLFVPNAVFARLFLGQRMSGRFVAGSAIALAGLALLFVQEARADDSRQASTLAGIALALSGVISASVANVMQASGPARALPMATMLGWGMLIGAALDGVLAFVISGPPQIEWRWGYLAGVAYLGIMASAVAFTFYFQTIRDIGPARAAYSSVVIPVIAMGFSTALEGYRWTALGLAGSAVALLGMVVALSAPRPAMKSG
jgi:drug/metabolite transporter (DMT)-like permease